MDKRLFFLFEDELFNEAKRIVPLVYNEKELTKFNTKNNDRNDGKNQAVPTQKLLSFCH